MKEYTITNMGKTFFVPEFAVEAFLPEFVEGIEKYLTAQSKAQPHKQQNAYKVLSKADLSKANEWLACLLVAPIAQYDDGRTVGELGLSGFTKYYAKAWQLQTKENPRDGFEAVIRLIRIFFDANKIVSNKTIRQRGQVEQLVVFTLTSLGEQLYPQLELEMADEEHCRICQPTTEPIEYMSAPWLPSCGDDHLKFQHEDVEACLANQASDASSVGFVIESSIANVYNDWFHDKSISENAKKKLSKFLNTKERSKYITIRRMQEIRREALVSMADTLLYYPVGFDRKARQYMRGYPLNPQGAKADRPLFSVLAEEAPIDRVKSDVTAIGEDLFGDDWEKATSLTLIRLNNHNDELVKEICSTKGELDLHKYSILITLSNIKEKEKQCLNYTEQ